MTLPESQSGTPTNDAVARERAFDALFRRHYVALCRFAARILGSDAEAEEVVQELFFYVWERHSVIADDVPPRAYLYRAAHNAALNRVRHRRVEHRWAEGKGKPSDETAGPAADELEQQELAAASGRRSSGSPTVPAWCTP